jgi:polyhydroxybutyrate depolymerase
VLVVGCGAHSGGGAAAHAPAHKAAACTPPGRYDIGPGVLHVPARPARNRPLVVAFHGARQRGAELEDYTGLSDLGEREGFAVLYPDAAEDFFWSLNAAAQPDDIPRVEALLDKWVPAACADPDRVYATGLSNGGGFTARAGCVLSERLAAVAPVAGGYRALDRCPRSSRTSLLEIHGSADTVVPYRGRGPQREGDVRRFVAAWARRAGCRRAPDIDRPARRVLRVRYRECAAGLAVEHLRLAGEGHGWPALTSERVWRFLRDKRLQHRG